MISYSKENVDAFIKSSTIMVKSAQEIGQELAGFSKSSLEEGVEASKKILAAKSVKEVVDLQNALVKDGFDKIVAESNKVSELYIKSLEEAFAPLTRQMNEALEKVFKPAV